MNQENRNYGHDQNIINQPGTVIIQGREKPVRPRSEQLLLQAISDEVNGRLAQSLHHAVLINLGKQVQPEQVRRPWDAEIKLGAKAPEPLPPETSILEIFTRKEVAGKLLILGDPGAGKTTTLLDLAQALVHLAEADSKDAIPVLLNLSSWKDPKLAMQDWVLEELKSKYGVKKELGRQWLAERQLLPLLDGLDEVKPHHQESCVGAINQWLQSELRPLYLVVCSRREEYGTYKTCLELNAAILLQALNDQQIQSYLARLQRSDLWQYLQQDESLLELLRTPLLLSMTVLSSSELVLEQWQQTTSTQRRLEWLLDAYVQTMLHRPLKSGAYQTHKPPTARQTRQWLIVLATQLHQESQTEFLLEKMQPRIWLWTARQKWTYRLMVGLIFGLMVGLIGGLKVDIETRIKPNQGIWNSAQNMAVLTTIGISLAIGLYWLLPPLFNPILSQSELYSLLAPVLVSTTWLTFQVGGGQACIQHVSLRLVLWWHNLIPWNYARFLDYSTERLLLQRVGGRYRFVHKLLQDHFARMGE